jgi:hypothetical protein
MRYGVLVWESALVIELLGINFHTCLQVALKAVPQLRLHEAEGGERTFVLHRAKNNSYRYLTKLNVLA